MGNTVVLMYHEGTEVVSVEQYAFLFRQNKLLTPFKLVGETAVFFD